MNFNYGEYIAEAIESVLSQTFKDFELIIIDDGSSDSSRATIEKYSKFLNVNAIFQSNKGLQACINRAINVARGDYIIRLDADDYFNENALLLLVNCLDVNKNVMMVYSDYYLVDAGGNLIAEEKRNNISKSKLKDKPAHGACSMFRKEFFMSAGMLDESNQRQDGQEIWLKLIEKFEIQNINLPIFYYRKHGKSLSDDKEKILETRNKIQNPTLSKVDT